MIREYRVSVGNALYLVGFSLVWFVCFVVFVLVPEVPHDLEPAHLAALAAVIAVGIAPALVTGFLPYKATLDDYGNLDLQSLFRSRRVRVAQIRAIVWDEEDIYLHYDGGKARVFADENFRDLLARVLELNPGIKIDDASRKLIGTPS